ncbi:acyl carrier protein [Xanthobacter sp. V4C-4]|uniref:acyl carrier protein n=1 Tax=Xanthobacter cornucopiae TaxID=3119924 RepID=UPI003728B050
MPSPTRKLDGAAVTAWVRTHLADFLDLPEDTVTEDAEFAALGLDSADSVIICGAFEEAFDVELDATLFLRNPNIASLIEDLRGTGVVA